MAEWHTPESARTQWADAPLDDEQLQELLDVAKGAVLAYAPVLTGTAPDPVTVTDGAWSVDLSGSGSLVTATATVVAPGGPGTVIIPVEYRPVGFPGFEYDATTLAYFDVGNSTILVLNAAGDTYPLSFTMLWTAASPAVAADVPTNYRVAQLTQAKNVWNGSYASPSGDLDGGSFGLTTFPLDWQVKQLLRPRSVFGGPVG